ncbi:hypothetical protein PIB30_086695 [Stylosanthes scabra]|uniref:GRF-type domain-containing protein n=1 Tax=Stylosanthes scabra TaxID=79078 RepID=A0ABU6UUC4_9FABA|nr:hypothetical protein [Stylosanthes scabra]
MASQSSNSSRFLRSNVQRRRILCGHGESPVLQVSNTKENPGRRFWGCAYYEMQDACDFFLWADPKPGHEDPEIARLKKKVSALKSKIKDGERQLKVAVMLGFIAGLVVGYLCFLNLQKRHEPGFLI